MYITLIQPDSPYLTYPLAFPNLGLLYISSALKKAGHTVEFIDLTGGGKLGKVHSEVIGVSCQITHWKAVREMDLKGRLIIGGPYPTYSDCKGFETVKGEGENKLLTLLGHKCAGYVDPNIWPDWEAIDLKRYGYSLEGKRCINIMTKRGNCPYRCAFCAKQEFGKSQLRFRTADNVLSEARYLQGKGFGALAIYDDDVLLDKARDREIFQGLKDLGMPYRCMTRTNLADRADLEMLKDTGCAEVCIGVETADNEIKKVIRKGTTIEQDTLFMKRAKEIGLRVKTYLMIGLPGESHESVSKTAKWLARVQPENYDVSVFTPYPGSEIYRNKWKYDIVWDEDELKRIWYSGEAQYGNCAVSTSHLTAGEILELKKDLEQFRGQSGTTDYWCPL
jgi:MoaA/NifB/PqqE/SkfB family radical SAM enzyme